jgi:DNA-binding NtrC family response regulator
MLPALRERREDIPDLVAHFVEMFSRRMSKEIEGIPPETMSALCSYDWPGNVRELQNLIERAVILATNGVLPNTLPHSRGEVVISTLPPTTLRGSERALILDTLNQVGWVIGGPRGAAAKLAVKRTTLLHKMKRLGISRPGHQQMSVLGIPQEDAGTKRRSALAD